MAEGRMIKKRVATSQKLSKVEDSAGFLYFMMYPHADLAGRIEADPMIIKGQMLTYFSWSPKKIQHCLENLNNVGLILLYEFDGNQYLEFTRFEDFQRLDPKREAGSIIPTPPCPPLLQRTPEDSAISKDKLSKDKLIKTEPSAVFKDDVWTETACGKAVNRLYKDGFNIYSLINRAKKELKWPKDRFFPEEVLLKVCDSYWKYKGSIKKPWPWFERMLIQFSGEFFANKNVEEHDAIKEEQKNKKTALPIGKIMEGMK